MTSELTQAADLPPRGNFPKGPRGETVAQRRERYEQFVLATDGGRPDYEWQSVTFYRGKTISVQTAPGSGQYKQVPAKPSAKLCINSLCWQCEGGGEDANAQVRIASCDNRVCALWPVRPYQDNRADRKAAVRAYCGQCAGGPNYKAPWQEVGSCASVTCALWPARPGNWRSADDSDMAGDAQ